MTFKQRLRAVGIVILLWIVAVILVSLLSGCSSQFGIAFKKSFREGGNYNYYPYERQSSALAGQRVGKTYVPYSNQSPIIPPR